VARGGWIYIMANRCHGTLYIGVTSDLAARVWAHREGIELIEQANPDWDDLFETINA